MKRLTASCLILLSIGLLAAASFAQSTEFAFQGRLTDAGVPVAVNYDLRFTLFSQSSGGAAIGTVERTDVPVSNGVFTVKLDFGGAAFDGSARWIETEVKPTGGGIYQPLNPRVFLTTVPYSVRSLTAANATQLGGVAATEFVQTTDPRMTDARDPLPNSSNYIRNETAGGATSNFNLGQGTGRAKNFDALTQYNIQSVRILGVLGTGNLFIGIDAGTNNLGGSNTFVGSGSGSANLQANSNTFVGSHSGGDNIFGAENSFFGANSGRVNETGGGNSYFGSRAGVQSRVGNFNAFFGFEAGRDNNANNNSFFGSRAGLSNTVASGNSFFGFESGKSNTAPNNSFFGSQAGIANSTGSGNSIFGTQAGFENTTGADNAFFGLNSGRGNTIGNRNTFYGRLSGRFNTSGDDNTFVGYNSASSSVTGTSNTALGANTNVSEGLTFATAIGAGATVSTSSTIQLGRASDVVNIPGKLRPVTLGSAGATALCRNAANEISTCSSSIRYKINVNNFSSSLDLIKKLRPVSFNWTVGGMPDIGLVAEEVAEVEPLLTTTNDKGEVEGVKYDRVGVVLVNAVNEQQQQIETLQKTVLEQKQAIEDLKALLCSIKPDAAACKQN